jgi:transposase-like protein
MAVSHQEVDMPFRYSSEFRQEAIARMLAGERVKDLAVELGVANPTLYKWRRQALVDAGENPDSRVIRPIVWPRPAGASRTSKTSSNWSRRLSKH